MLGAGDITQGQGAAVQVEVGDWEKTTKDVPQTLLATVYVPRP